MNIKIKGVSIIIARWKTGVSVFEVAVTIPVAIGVWAMFYFRKRDGEILKKNPPKYVCSVDLCNVIWSRLGESDYVVKRYFKACHGAIG